MALSLSIKSASIGPCFTKANEGNWGGYYISLTPWFTFHLPGDSNWSQRVLEKLNFCTQTRQRFIYGTCKLEKELLRGVTYTKNCFYQTVRNFYGGWFSFVASATLLQLFSVVELFLKILQEFRTNLLKKYLQKAASAVFNLKSIFLFSGDS